MNTKPISIVIPCANEQGSIRSLIERIDNTLSSYGIVYEIIFVDDNSTDSTQEVIHTLCQNYPISLYLKKGRPGKAQSLIEGFSYAKYDWIVMVDADLQYSPEAIPAMIAKSKNCQMVVANRKVYKSGFNRKLASRLNNFFFGKILFNLDCDVQSGLKLFKKDIAQALEKSSIPPWAIDIPLLFTTLELGYRIGTVDITFEKRKNGQSKISFFQTAWQIAIGAIRLRLRKRRIYNIASINDNSMLGAGLVHNRRRFITHTTLPEFKTALTTLKTWQKFIIFFFLSLFILGFFISPLKTAVLFVAILSSVYFIDVFFNLFLIVKSLREPPEIKISDVEIDSINEKDLPIYSIICPLYKEAHILPQFLESLEKLDWPKDKLDVILLLEEDDRETFNIAYLIAPIYSRILVVPNNLPKTKPKACNYGLSQTRGDYVVIYDAEDIPDPKQLKTAYLAFKRAKEDTICLQAKLNYYNPHHNLLTRLFTAEYSLWFDVILPGLQALSTSIPLGGTSNHFRKKDLVKLAGWDTFNVTEDCDLGVRLFKEGYKTAIIDSITLEEANSNIFNWFRQRSRWIKGYIQTYFVHMRNPISFWAISGIHAFIFQLIVGGKIAFILINPLLWLATFSYFALYSLVGPLIESLYPTQVFYMAVVSLVFGNFLYLYYYMIGCAKRGHWSVIKYSFFVPIYWLFISFGGAYAVLQLIFKPHFWEKTHHGLHLPKRRQFDVITSTPTLRRETWQSARRIHLKLPSYFTSAGILVAASIFGNFFNFLYNAYLGRNILVEEFGLVSMFASIFYLSQIITTSVSSTVAFQSAYLFGKYKNEVKQLWSYSQKVGLGLAFFFSGLWLAGIPVLNNFFQTGNSLPFILFTPVWFVGFIGAVNFGYLTGNHKFVNIATIIVVETLTKFIAAFILVNLGLGKYAYVAIPLSITAALLVGFLVVLLTHSKDVNLEKKEVGRLPRRFFTTSILLKITTFSFLSVDVILAKHFLSATAAGNYALLSLVGKIIFFGGVLFSQFIVPVVGRLEGAGQDSKKIFQKLLLLTTLSSLLGYTVFGLFGEMSVPILFGQKTFPIIPYLPIYTLAMCYFAISSCIVSYHQVKREYVFPIVSLLIPIIQIVAIYLFHNNIETISFVMLFTGIAYASIIFLLHIFYQSITPIIKNINDLFGLFLRVPTAQFQPTYRLRILIFNWRDTKHVWAGGAEVYIHELAKRWVKEGNQVTLFCGNDGKNKRFEIIDGVEIVRRGGFYTVYIWAFLYYLLKFRGKFDVVIDSQNGIPFFTPIYVGVPKFLLIHHVHQDVFRRHLPFPLSFIAMVVESKLMPLFYQNQKIITISASSKKEILKLGRFRQDYIEIVSPGISARVNGKKEKTPYPSFVYLGRLKPYKNVDIAIKAFAKILKDHPNSKLFIAGNGESLTSLKQLTDKLELNGTVTFLGKVSEREKFNLLTQSWIALHPSSFEGWGITVLEANVCGTPVIASNVQGLRDSVVYRKTGLLVPEKQVGAFAAAMDSLISLPSYRKLLSRGALRWSQNFSWEKSAQVFKEIIVKELVSKQRWPLNTKSLALSHSADPGLSRGLQNLTGMLNKPA